MKILIAPILFAIMVNFTSTEDAEQIAVDYFVEKILNNVVNEYGYFKPVSCSTGKPTRFDERGICFDNDYKLWEQVQQNSRGSSTEEHPLIIHHSALKRSAKNKMFIYNSTKANSNFYVEIRLSIPKHDLLKSYFFEIGQGKVLRTCNITVTVD